MEPIIIDNKILLAGTFIIDDKNNLLTLHRRDFDHYETPGGKVEVGELKDPRNPTLEELAKVALRETYEELGNQIYLSKLYPMGHAEVRTRDGRNAVVYKFATTILGGEPRVNEPTKFSELKYLPIKELDKYPIAPSLKAFLPILKEYFLH